MASSKAATRSSNVVLGLGGGRQLARKSAISFRWEGVSRSICSSRARIRCSADCLRSERSDISSQSRGSSSRNQADGSTAEALPLFCLPPGPEWRFSAPFGHLDPSLQLPPTIYPIFKFQSFSLLTRFDLARDGRWRDNDDEAPILQAMTQKIELSAPDFAPFACNGIGRKP